MADGYASAKPDVTIAPGAEAPERGIHTEIVRSKPQTFFNAPLITESALNKLPVKDRIRMDIGRPYPKQYQLGEPRTVLDVALVEPVATMAQTIFSKAANLNDALYQLSDALNKDFGLPKAETLKELSLLAENAAKDAEKLGIPANESIVSKITSELYKGLGGVAFDLPIINAIGLPAYMGAMGGAESYREHGAFLPGVATGLIKGKAFSSALHGTASLPKYIGGASTGALFGSMSLLDETSKPDKDIDWSNVISQTIIGTLLAYNPNRQSLFAWMKRNLGDTPAVANLDDRNLSYLREIFKSGKDVPEYILDYVKNIKDRKALSLIIREGKVPTDLAEKIKYDFLKFKSALTKIPPASLPEPLVQKPAPPAPPKMITGQAEKPVPPAEEITRPIMKVPEKAPQIKSSGIHNVPPAPEQPIAARPVAPEPPAPPITKPKPSKPQIIDRIKKGSKQWDVVKLSSSSYELWSAQKRNGVPVEKRPYSEESYLKFVKRSKSMSGHGKNITYIPSSALDDMPALSAVMGARVAKKLPSGEYEKHYDQIAGIRVGFKNILNTKSDKFDYDERVAEFNEYNPGHNVESFDDLLELAQSEIDNYITKKGKFSAESAEPEPEDYWGEVIRMRLDDSIHEIESATSLDDLDNIYTEMRRAYGGKENFEKDPDFPKLNSAWQKQLAKVIEIEKEKYNEEAQQAATIADAVDPATIRDIQSQTQADETLDEFQPAGQETRPEQPQAPGTTPELATPNPQLVTRNSQLATLTARRDKLNTQIEKYAEEIKALSQRGTFGATKADQSKLFGDERPELEKRQADIIKQRDDIEARINELTAKQADLAEVEKGKTTGELFEGRPVGAKRASPEPVPPESPSAGKELWQMTHQELVNRYSLGNPFAEKAARYREKENKLSHQTEKESAMANAFPFGVGASGKKPQNTNRQIDASIDRAVESVQAQRNAKYYEAKALAFDEGKINAQGRRASKRADEMYDKRLQRKEETEKARAERKGKEVWQVTQDTYLKSSQYRTGSGAELVKYEHKTAVEKALSEGQPVPPEVLADYPDLAVGAKPASTESIPAEVKTKKENPARPVAGRVNPVNPVKKETFDSSRLPPSHRREYDRNQADIESIDARLANEKLDENERLILDNNRQVMADANQAIIDQYNNDLETVKSYNRKAKSGRPKSNVYRSSVAKNDAERIDHALEVEKNYYIPVEPNENPRVYSGDEGKNLIGKLKRDRQGKHYGVRSIAEYLDKALGVETRVGRVYLTRKHPAHYETTPRLIRTKTSASPALMFHEQGHALFDLLQNDNPKWYRGWADKLKDITRMTGSLASAKSANEGFAEWTRRFITNYNSIADFDFTKFAEKYLSEKQPAYYNALRDAQTAYRYHASRGFFAVASSFGNDKIDPSVRQEIAKAKNSFAYGIASGWGFENIDRNMYRLIVKGAIEEFAASKKLANRMAREYWRLANEDTNKDFKTFHQLTLHIPGFINEILDGVPGAKSGVFVYLPDGSRSYLTNKSWNDIKSAVGDNNWDRFEKYTQYRAALARWDKNKQPYPGMGAEFPPDVVRKNLSAIEREYPDYPGYANDVRDFFNALLDITVWSGEKTLEEVKTMKEFYDYYVYLPRDLSDRNPTLSGFPSGGLRSSGIRGAHGSYAPFVPLDIAAAKRVQGVISHYYNNLSALSLIKALDAVSSDQDLPEIARVSAARVITPIPLKIKKVASLSWEEARDVIYKYLIQQPEYADIDLKKDEIDFTWGGQSVFRPAAPVGFQVLAVYENGQRNFYQVIDPILYHHFAGARNPIKFLVTYDKIFSQLTGPWKRMITSTLNFLKNNIMRDTNFVIINDEAWESLIPCFYHLVGLIAKITGQEPQLSGFSETLSHSLEYNFGETHRFHTAKYKRKLLDRASNAINEVLTRGYISRRDLKYMSFWDKGVRYPLNLVFNTTIKPLDIGLFLTHKLNNWVEELPRLGKAVWLKRSGASDARYTAAFDQISGNFSEHSGFSNFRHFTHPLGFTNPRLQISYQTAKRATDPDPKIRARMYVGFGAIALSAAFLAFLKILTWKKEDDIIESERPNSDHFNAFSLFDIRFPFADGIPGVVQSLTWNIIINQYKDLPERDRKEYAISLLKRFVEFSGTPVALFPPSVQMIVELQANHNFYFDSDIVPPLLLNLPPSEQYLESTPEVYRKLGEVLSMSPIKIEYFMKNIGYQQYNYLIHLVSDIESGRKYSDKSEYPFFGRLFVKHPTGYFSYSVQEIEKKMKESAHFLRKAITEKVGEKAYKDDIYANIFNVLKDLEPGSKEYNSIRTQLFYYWTFDQAAKDIHKCNDIISDIKRNVKLTPDEYSEIEDWKLKMRNVAHEWLLESTSIEQINKFDAWFDKNIKPNAK